MLRVRVVRRGARQACQWAAELENGFRIYHMGDTGMFGDLGLIGELYRPDLVLMRIGEPGEKVEF